MWITLGSTKENASNKKTTLTDSKDTDYPTTKSAVNTGLALKADQTELVQLAGRLNKICSWRGY